MFPLPSGYLALAVTLALGASFVGGHLNGRKAERAAWEAVIAQQKATAAAMLATAQEQARKKEAEDAERARQADADYQARIAALQDGAVDRERDLLGSLQRLQGRWRRCELAASRAPEAAGRPEDAAPGGVDPVLEKAARDFRQLGDSADRLAVWAQACHKWAVEVGR